MISKQLALGITLARGAVPIKDPHPPVDAHASVTSAAQGTHPDLSALESSLASMVSEIREARDAEDLDWRLGEQISGGPLQDCFEQSFELVPHVSDQELEVPLDELDPVIRELLPSFLASLRLSTAMLATLEGEHRSDLHELLFGPSSPGLQEVLYHEDVPPDVQAALYDGYASYLCLITLLDERPRPAWLDAELRRRALEGQHHHLRLLVALARDAGVEIPESGPLSSLEPLDLEQATRQGAKQRTLVDAYLDSRKSCHRS